MIKIPNENNAYFVSNASDLIPNIQYTKNIDLDEEGYIKLSPPFPKLTSSTETAGFGTLADAIQIGTSDSEYKLATDGSIFDIDLDSLSITLDASAPAGTVEGRFVGWKGGDWYYNGPSDIYSLQASAGTVWDIENTDNEDYIEIFVSRNTLVGSGTSTVEQYLTTDMDGTTPPSTNSGATLTIPANFTITGMAYSNYRIGIATYNDTKGQAYFFTWDGSTTEAGQGIPVSANQIIDVVAYQNSWVILTSKGQLLRFNGGGFDVLGNLPSYYFDANWIGGVGGIEVTHGRMMSVDGDIIYFNIGTLLDADGSDSGLLQGFYSGIWCYDPTFKCIYHRYGLSNSKLYTVSLSPTANVYTSADHQLTTGDKVLYSSTIYYAIYLTSSTFSLATTYDLAVLGTVATSAPNGTMIWIKREDWSQLAANNSDFGACIRFDSGGNLLSDGVLPFFAGLRTTTKAGTSTSTTCLMAPKFDNVGSVCYYKMKANEIEDMYNSIIVKHRKLIDGDKIIIKYKIRDNYEPISIGEANDISPDIYITWVTSTSFTTTKDLTDVEEGDEVEFYAGAGAGSTAHVVSTTNNAGTWTVVIDEAIRGGASGNRSTCIFDSFKKAGVITKDTQETNNVFTQRVGEASKSIQVKLELRGRGVAIEEMIVDNIMHMEII